MKLLHLDSSILGPHSVTHEMSGKIVSQLAGSDPTIEVVYRDLVEDSVDHLTGAYLQGLSGQPVEDTTVQDELVRGAQILDEFLAADIVVIGAPMYNFTISSQLKTWIDRILVAGKTFKYTETGAVGLAGDKRVILALSRGGFYAEGTPMHAFEHLETYLRGVFGFVGVTRLEVFAANGIAMGEAARTEALENASQAIASLTV